MNDTIVGSLDIDIVNGVFRDYIQESSFLTKMKESLYDTLNGKSYYLNFTNFRSANKLKLSDEGNLVEKENCLAYPNEKSLQISFNDFKLKLINNETKTYSINFDTIFYMEYEHSELQKVIFPSEPYIVELNVSYDDKYDIIDSSLAFNVVGIKSPNKLNSYDRRTILNLLENVEDTYDVKYEVLLSDMERSKIDDSDSNSENKTDEDVNDIVVKPLTNSVSQTSNTTYNPVDVINELELVLNKLKTIFKVDVNSIKDMSANELIEKYKQEGKITIKPKEDIKIETKESWLKLLPNKAIEFKANFTMYDQLDRDEWVKVLTNIPSAITKYIELENDEEFIDELCIKIPQIKTYLI